MRILKRLLPLCAAVCLLPGFFRAGEAVCEDAAGQTQPVACATVSFVEGAPVLVESASTPRPVTTGQTLYAGSTVQTDSASRIELTFTGGGIVRLAGGTTLGLGVEPPETGESGVGFQAMLLEGEMWANFLLQRSSVRILATVAMFSGPESVFRLVMFKEGAVEVKAYTGKVTASGPFEIKKEDGRYELGPLKGTVEGTPESWRCQITPYRKMIAMASGEASQPFRFAAKSDFTDWVRWNQQRDEAGR